MRPILFSKTSTTFTTNGLGRLDAILCKVIEERNGAYELEMEIAETADHASQIEADSIIVAKPSQADSLQPFRVYKLTKPINGKFTVLARHISYELNVITTMPFSVAQSAQACANTLAALKSNAVGSCPFSFSTDVTTASSYKQTVPASIRSRLGGSEGSVLQQFGGELKWDNYNVYLYSHRGLITPQVTLRYGKNIIDFNQEENIENTITGIVPYWTNSEGGDLVTLTEKVIEVPNASSFPYKKSIPMDFSRDFDEKPTQADLKAKAQAYVNTNNIGVPKVSIKLSFVNLSDTVDYKDIAAFQTVSLCDMVNVQFEKLGISTTAEVIKTDYDVLKERYNSIEIGSLRSTLASTISGAMQEIGDIQTTTQEMIKTNNTSINTLINTATAWLTSADGYVIAIKDPNTGAWKELLFADHDDPEQWHYVLRINQNGIGFSSNGGQTYTQAWTLDGHLVIGGTDVPSLTVYDSHNNVIFQATAAGTIWNSTNSSMTQDGTLTIKNATISGGMLSVLKPNAANPPTDSDYLFKVNASGLLWNLAKSQMTSDGALKVKDLEIDQGYLRIVNPNYQDWEIYPDGHVDNPDYPPYTVQYLVEMGYDGTAQSIDGLSWHAIHSMLSKQGELSFMGKKNNYNTVIKLTSNEITCEYAGQQTGSIEVSQGGFSVNGNYFAITCEVLLNDQIIWFNDAIPRLSDHQYGGHVDGVSNTATFYDINGTPYKIRTINGIVTSFDIDIT